MSTCNTARNTALQLGDRLRQERGQSVVEFAVVLPVLILIILGIIYFGRYEDYANQETQLAETGVRWAAIGWQSSGYTMPSSCSTATPPTGVTSTTYSTSLQCYILAQGQPELRTGSSDVNNNQPAQVWIYQPSTASSYASGQPVRVCIVASVSFPSPIGTPTVKMAEAATMRIEQVPSTFTATPWASANPNGATTPPSSTNCPLN